MKDLWWCDSKSSAETFYVLLALLRKGDVDLDTVMQYSQRLEAGTGDSLTSFMAIPT